VKMHTLLDLRGNIPSFIHISDGKMSDVKVLDLLPVEAGAFYVMDRGYLDFGRLFKLHQAGAFFVTRAKRGMDARRVYSAKTDRTTGVICDQAIRLNGFYVAKNYPEHLRRNRLRTGFVGLGAVRLALGGGHRAHADGCRDHRGRGRGTQSQSVAEGVKGVIPDTPIPVTLLTGFLGSSKTTLLNRLLKARPLTAPRLADDTNLVYFAKTPRV